MLSAITALYSSRLVVVGGGGSQCLQILRGSAGVASLPSTVLAALAYVVTAESCAFLLALELLYGCLPRLPWSIFIVKSSGCLVTAGQ